MTQIDSFTEFQTGFKKLPFHIITLTILLFLGVNGTIPSGQTKLLMSILAGVMLSPFYNGLASLMYNITDNFLTVIFDNIPNLFKPIMHILLGHGLLVADAYSIANYGFLDLTSIYFLINTIMIWLSILFDLWIDNSSPGIVQRQASLDEYL